MAVYSSPEVTGVTLLYRFQKGEDVETALQHVANRILQRADDIRKSERRVSKVEVTVTFE